MKMHSTFTQNMYLALVMCQILTILGNQILMVNKIDKSPTFNEIAFCLLRTGSQSTTYFILTFY